MKIYIIGIVFGFLLLIIQNIITKDKEHESLLFTGNYCCKIQISNNCIKHHKEQKKRIKILPVLFLLILIILIFLFVKYNFIEKIKPIAINVIDALKPIAIKAFNLAKQIFLFILGLCTPYLSKIATKKLKKLRKKLKKSKKKKNKNRTTNIIKRKNIK